MSEGAAHGDGWSSAAEGKADYDPIADAPPQGEGQPPPPPQGQGQPPPPPPGSSTPRAAATGPAADRLPRWRPAAPAASQRSARRVRGALRVRELRAPRTLLLLLPPAPQRILAHRIRCGALSASIRPSHQVGWHRARQRPHASTASASRYPHAHVAQQPVRVRVEITGSHKCKNARKSQSVLIMINPIIVTRTP